MRVRPMPPGSTKKPRARPSPRPAGASSTRQRLIEAAIEIVRTEGPGSLTTVEITRRTGIAQPGFYKHFRNVDDCLEEATTQVLDGMHKTFSAMRAAIQDRSDSEEVARHCLAVLEVVAEDRPFNEMIGRYRLDPSTLGRAIRDVEARVLSDFADELWAQAHAAGLGREHRPELAFVAELSLSATRATIERVLAAPDADLKKLAQELADFTIGGTRVVIGHLLGKRVRANPSRKG